MLGCVVFGVIIGLFGTLLMQQKLLGAKVDTQLGELKEFLLEKKVSQSGPAFHAKAGTARMPARPDRCLAFPLHPHAHAGMLRVHVFGGCG